MHQKPLSSLKRLVLDSLDNCSDIFHTGIGLNTLQDQFLLCYSCSGTHRTNNLSPPSKPGSLIWIFKQLFFFFSCSFLASNTCTPNWPFWKLRKGLIYVQLRVKCVMDTNQVMQFYKLPNVLWCYTEKLYLCHKWWMKNTSSNQRES